MKHASIITAAAVVVLANALALIHAARNRSDEAQAEITLTARELTYDRDPNDSGVALDLRVLSCLWWTLKPEEIEARCLGKTKLQELGFDCSVAPSDPKAESFYARQIPRTGFVALECDGAGWQSWLESDRQGTLTRPGPAGDLDIVRRTSSRLVVIDAAYSAGALRVKDPDRCRVLIVPAVISISFNPASQTRGGRPAGPARLTGYVREIPSEIHVPRPFSNGFRGLPQPSRDEKREAPLYRVRLRYGSLLEPWVTGVEFVK